MSSGLRLRYFVLIFFAFLAQNAFAFLFGHNAPPFLLISVVFYALYEGVFAGLILGCYAGFFLDLFGTGPLGLQMLIYGIMGIGAALAASKFFRESFLTRTVLPVLCGYAVVFLNLLVYKASTPGEVVSLGLLKEAFLWPYLFWTALFSPFCFGWLKEISFPEEKRRARAFIMRN